MQGHVALHLEELAFNALPFSRFNLGGFLQSVQSVLDLLVIGRALFLRMKAQIKMALHLRHQQLARTRTGPEKSQQQRDELPNFQFNPHRPSGLLM